MKFTGFQPGGQSPKLPNWREIFSVGQLSKTPKARFKRHFAADAAVARQKYTSIGRSLKCHYAIFSKVSSCKRLENQLCQIFQRHFNASWPSTILKNLSSEMKPIQFAPGINLAEIDELARLIRVIRVSADIVAIQKSIQIPGLATVFLKYCIWLGTWNPE